MCRHCQNHRADIYFLHGRCWIHLLGAHFAPPSATQVDPPWPEHPFIEPSQWEQYWCKTPENFPLGDFIQAKNCEISNWKGEYILWNWCTIGALRSNYLAPMQVGATQVGSPHPPTQPGQSIFLSMQTILPAPPSPWPESNLLLMCRALELSLQCKELLQKIRI